MSCNDSKKDIEINIYGQLFKIMHEDQREGIISLPTVIFMRNTKNNKSPSFSVARPDTNQSHNENDSDP